MADYVSVNGAQIERDFFDANVAEARACDWEKIDSVSMTEEHHHCIVCDVAMTEGPCYRSGHRWLCSYCQSHFVEEAE